MLTAIGGDPTPPISHAQSKPIEVKLQLKWFPQSQFAGYLVAQEKGFYEQEGLKVTLLPIGDQSPIQTVAVGGADFGTTWITDLLTARAQGLPVVHIAQMFQKSGYAMVALKSTNISKPEDFKGKKIGIWPSGNEYPALALLKKVNLTTSLDTSVSNPDVELVTYGFDPAQVFPDKVDVASAMVYNELNQIVGLGYPLDQLTVMALPDYDINLLEDLIFTTEKVLAESNFKGSGLSGKTVAAKLLKASLAGWDYAVNNPAETVQTVLSFCGETCKGSGSEADPVKHQTWQMSEIAKLYQAGPTLEGNAGLLDPQVFTANVETLKSLGILQADPDAKVVDYSVWEEATGKQAPTS
ncbi:MAG: ABC transporter substrate-binding protein [Cyanobacteriota bacterium]|nr:ABC transporter substrate-binding protein [Cyanobacteriota bacterium]